MKQVKVSDLQLGDVVKLFDNAFGTATVIKKNQSEVTMFRPYTATSDFSYGAEESGSQVIPYTGHEMVVYQVSSATIFEVYYSNKAK